LTTSGNDSIFLPDRVGRRSRPVRSTAGTRLAEAIAAEKLDENGVSCRWFVLPRDAKVSAKRKRPIADGSHHDRDAIATDVEDETYADPVSEGGGDDDSSNSSDDDIEIRNDEVRIRLFLLISARANSNQR
jgi:hypothetical protein